MSASSSWNLLGKLGIEGATLNHRWNKQVHLGAVTDNQVEQCSKEKFDWKRFSQSRQSMALRKGRRLVH